MEYLAKGGQAMRDIKFKEQNKDLTKPEGMTDEQCYTLHVYNDGKQSISCWRASPWERVKVLFTGRVWLSVHFGETQPPVWLSGHYPFKGVNTKAPHILARLKSGFYDLAMPNKWRYKKPANAK